MSNNISDLQNELAKLLENKFFFRKPDERKVYMYIISYILLIFLSIATNTTLIATLFIVFPLSYVLGAKGYRAYVPLVVGTLVMASFFASGNTIFWLGINSFLAVIIYEFIARRYAKISLVLFITLNKYKL